MNSGLVRELEKLDGIEDKENSSESWGIKQVLCDECGGAIRYRPPSFWKKLRAEGVPTLREICLRLRRSLQCHTNRNISRIARRENAPRPMHSCPNHRHRQPWLPVAAPRRRRTPRPRHRQRASSEVSLSPLAHLIRMLKKRRRPSRSDGGCCEKGAPSSGEKMVIP